MNKLKEILYNNQWFSKPEIEELFTNDIIKSINECERPNKENIFNAFNGLQPQDVKVLIIGQDPYPNENRADGMAFSFGKETKAKDSLKNIFDRIEELGIKNTNPNLEKWKARGVLLLNTSLTLKKDKNKSIQSKLKIEHAKAWTPFINSVIKKLIEKKHNKPLVIMLFGKNANLLDEFKNDEEDKDKLEDKNLYIIRTSHPSNIGNAKNYSGNYSNQLKHDVKAFMNKSNNPFKKCNEFLEQKKLTAINWSTD